MRASGWVTLLVSATAWASLDAGTAQQTTVRAPSVDPPSARGQSTVSRADLERRLPRSAPDALRFEPGVFVQQSAHGQGSAFIRGLTGQQTLVLFDGIRLNNSTWRQGPNQYLFTVDSSSLDSIEVLRGGASTRFGSDALGGVLLAQPLQPTLGPRELRAALRGRSASADGELGGRAQVRSIDERWGVLVGGGGRSAGLLESSGPLSNPPDVVPRLAPDGRRQLGTGFKELTADGRVVFQPSERHRFTAAAYLYRQYDAPRTDLCPPATARFDECLTYAQQFRSLAYAAWDGSGLGAAAHSARVTLSWQQQHERRTGVRPASFVTEQGTDDVDTLGVTATATTRFEGAPLQLSWGADCYFDAIRSRASIGFTDLGVSVERSRGQYLEGSTALTGGAFADAQLRVQRWTVRGGARVGWATVSAPAEPASGTQAVEGQWIPIAGHLGVDWQPLPLLSVVANVDHSFRAPNLDDLTSRQQTGAGFQFENPALRPEQATTFEAGAQLGSSFITAELWVFRMLLANAIGRAPREADQCPAQTPACSASWFRYQLINASSAAVVSGAEVSLRMKPARSLTVQTNASWTVGDGPNPVAAGTVPLSRIPPINGTLEVGWLHPEGGGLGAALRWAGPQNRLAISDRSDVRIPLGGTPGFAVVDLRASYRLREVLTFAMVLENLFDSPYRTHGSSVNGPGRGVLLTLELSPEWTR